MLCLRLGLDGLAVGSLHVLDVLLQVNEELLASLLPDVHAALVSKLLKVSDGARAVERFRQSHKGSFMRWM
jgi:hypothetical protein